MDPLVIVDPASVTVAPGGQMTVTVSVRNQGQTNDTFRLDVLGDAAGWSQVSPAMVEVGPQGQAMAAIAFAPPSSAAGATTGGAVPFGVRVQSVTDPTSSAVAEGDLVVSEPGRASVKLTPDQSKGWRSGHHRLEVSNWGGGPARLSFEATHVSKAFDVRITPPTLDVPIGGTETAELVVQPRSTFVRGDRVRHRFQVVARGADMTQTVVDGGYEQRPLIGRLPLVIGLAAIVAVLGFFAFAWLSGLGGDDDAADRGDGTADTLAADLPQTPQEFAAEAVSSDLVHLTWVPVPDADSYVVVSLDPATAEQAEPTVVQTFEGIPTTQGGFDAVDLLPSSPYCFQVLAVRAATSSAPSAPQCVDTLALAATGGPTEVTVEAIDAGRARVRWVDGSQGQNEHLVRHNGPVVAIVPPGTSEAVLELEEGENCFRVQARSAGATSAASDQQCVAGPTATTVPEDLEVIVVVQNGVIPVTDPQAEQRANQRRDELRAAGHAAEVLNTADYPRLSRETGEFLWVYIGGFPTEADAMAYCQTAGLQCITEEPGGRGG